MGLTVFELQAIIGLDSSSFETKLKAVGIKLAEFGLKFAKESMQVGAEFDKSMSQVAATMGKTVEEVEKETHTVGNFTGSLREFAQKLGETTKFTASEAAQALNYMALAGYDAEKSMEMLPNVLNLAAAGDFDLARASDMVTDAQTAFALTTERTTQMVAEMAKAASTGNTTVEMLGDAFLVVGGLAKELNGGLVTLEDGTQATTDGVQELEIALTAMANAGVKGSEAGTHMRNMLLKLSSPTDQGTIALENMGVAVFDTEGKMRSLSEIFGDLNEAMSTMTQQDRIQTISDLFNTRDMASAEALLSAMGEDWDKIGRSILQAKGAAQKMSDTQLDNLAGDITKFKSAFEGLQIAFSDNVKNPFRDIVQYATEGVSKLTEAMKTGDWTNVINVASEWLTDTAKIIAEKIPPLIEKLKPALEALVKAIGEVLITLIPIIVPTMIEIGKALLEALFKGLGEIEGWGPVLQGVFVALFAGKAFTALSAFSDKIWSVVEGLKKMTQTKFTFPSGGGEGTGSGVGKAGGGTGGGTGGGGLLKTLGTSVTEVGAGANIAGAFTGFSIGTAVGNVISNKLYESGAYGEDSGGVLEEYANKSGLGKWGEIFEYIGKGVEDLTVGTTQAIESYNNKTQHALEMGYSSWAEYREAMLEKYEQMQADGAAHAQKVEENGDKLFKAVNNSLPIPSDVANKWEELGTIAQDGSAYIADATKSNLAGIPSDVADMQAGISTTIQYGVDDVVSSLDRLRAAATDNQQQISDVADATKSTLAGVPSTVLDAMTGASSAVNYGVDDMVSSLERLRKAASRAASSIWDVADASASSLAGVPSDVLDKMAARHYATAVDNPVIFDKPEYAMVGDGTEPEILMGISTFKAMLEQAQNTIQAQVNVSSTSASGTNDTQERQIIIPVYIGDEQIDEIVVDALRRQQYLTGGR